MAKILVEDPEGNTRVPFLRGILTRSLQNSGLAFEEAYRAATRIRKDLGDSAVISSDDLRNRVVELLKADYGAKVVNRYQQQTLVVTPIQVRHSDGRVTPFNGDQHRRCLETIGLTYEEAITVMAHIRQHFLDKRVTQTTSQHIAHLTYRCLHQTPELGPAVAHRWLVWIDFLRSGRPLVLLIGGTSGCGKSTVATALANQLDIVRMQSTDMLREVMRTMISERLLPILHTSSFNAWSVLAEQKSSLEQDDELLLAEGFRAQVDLLSAASEAVIERTLRERVWLIMEGVHIHPSILEKLPQDTDAVIAPIMLAVLKRRDLKERIRGRSTKAPQRRSSRYLEHFDAIWQLQSFLLSEADRTRIPIILNGDRDKVVREIMRTVIDGLAENFTATPAEVFRNNS
ncbi:MAG: AAA family ATPase [Gammaproteobacteria bacterium]|nr:MAG: AAA family ATPase [Gammaproteobacteria bacterium]